MLVCLCVSLLTGTWLPLIQLYTLEMTSELPPPHADTGEISDVVEQTTQSKPEGGGAVDGGAALARQAAASRPAAAAPQKSNPTLVCESVRVRKEPGRTRMRG